MARSNSTSKSSSSSSKSSFSTSKNITPSHSSSHSITPTSSGSAVSAISSSSALDSTKKNPPQLTSSVSTSKQPQNSRLQVSSLTQPKRVVKRDKQRTKQSLQSRYRSQRQGNNLGILGVLSILGSISRLLFRTKRIQFSMSMIKKQLVDAKEIDLMKMLPAATQPMKGLYFGVGKFRVENDNQILSDRAFGIQASSAFAMKLRRRIERLYEEESEDKRNEEPKWVNPEYYNLKTAEPQNLQDIYSEKQYFPRLIKIGDHFIVQNEQVRKFDSNNERTISLDGDLIDEHYLQLKEQAEALLERGRLTQEEQELVQLYENHIFTYAIKNEFQIAYLDDSIYIRQSEDENTPGDIRITFREQKPFSQVSVMAGIEQREEGGQTLNYFKKYELEQLKMQSVNVEVFVNGEKLEQSLNYIEIFELGKLSKQEVIDKYLTKIKTDNKHKAKIYYLLIFLCYAAGFSIIGNALNPLNWFKKNNVSNKVISKTGNTYTFNSKNAGIFSQILALPFAALHIATVNALAAASVFKFAVGAGVIFGYVLYSHLTSNKQLRDEEEEIEKIPDIIQYHEELSSKIENNVELDEKEERILSYLKDIEGRGEDQAEENE